MAPPSDTHTKGDSPLSDRGPSWQRSPRRCNSTTVTVLLADGVVQPSRASKQIDVPTSVSEIRRHPLIEYCIPTCIRGPIDSLTQCMLCQLVCVLRGGGATPPSHVRRDLRSGDSRWRHGTAIARGNSFSVPGILYEYL